MKAYREGALSGPLAALTAGARLCIQGPLGGAPAPPPRLRACGFVAGGTGITPMLQLILSMAARRAGGGAAPPALHLLYYNHEAEDVLLRAELDQLAQLMPALTVTYFLTAPAGPPAGWTGAAGRPSRAAFEAHLPAAADDVRVFWCGPPAFNDSARSILGGLGFTDEMVHEFS